MAMVTVERPVTDFNRIDLRGYGDILLTQGEQVSLKITADEKLIPRLISEVRGGTLVLDQERGWLEWLFSSHSPIHYEIGVVKLDGVSISGSGSLTAARLVTETLAVRISGSGKIHIDDLQSQTVDLSLSGSAEIRLAGVCARQQVHSSGSASVQALDLAGREAEVRISGSGEARVNVEERLDIHISGTGTVYYRGNPQISERISGSGRIEQVR